MREIAAERRLLHRQGQRIQSVMPIPWPGILMLMEYPEALAWLASGKNMGHAICSGLLDHLGHAP